MNVKGIYWFLQEVLPQVKLHHPKLQIILAGTICEVEGLDHCIKLGKVTHLKEVYDRAHIVINSIPYGTGLKIKTIEALGYAKPLVTTSVGAEGLEKGINRAFLVADNPGEFAQAIIRILDDPTFADLLSSCAYDFAKQWNEDYLQELANILEH